MSGALGRTALTCARTAKLAFTDGGLTLTERPAIAKALVKHQPNLLGKSPVAEALVNQWLLWLEEAPVSGDRLKQLNTHLTASSYVAGHAFTVVDSMAFYDLSTFLSSLSNAELAAYPAVLRWYAQVANEPNYALSKVEGAPAALAASSLPLRKPARAFFCTSAAAAPAVADAAPTASSEAAPAAADKEAKKKAAKEKKAAAAAAAPPPAAEVDPVAHCDIRVGKITKVWCHPNAERLYCEEIDVGEGKSRPIASGLREHYKLEELDGRMVVVICNLKPRPLVGFESNGMVLAATSPEGKVELVDPPAGAKVGERVSFEGHTGSEPAAPNAMAKKKYFDIVAESLRVDDSLTATYKGIPFMTSAGPCTVPSAKGGTIH